MEKRTSRVSEAQWAILLEFLESNPNLARSKGFNNTAQGRNQASKLWQEVTNLLNAEGSGVTKAPKDWAIRKEKQLKKLWDNMKVRKKALLPLEKRQHMQTGGGAYPKETTTSDDAVLMVEALLDCTDELQFVSDSDSAATQASIDANRNQIIQNDFKIRKNTYAKKDSREEEIHKLKIQELNFKVKAAEEQYKKNKVERELAELQLKTAKDTHEKSNL